MSPSEWGPFEWTSFHCYTGNHLATWAPRFHFFMLSLLSHRIAIQVSLTQHAAKRRRSGFWAQGVRKCVGVYLSLVMWVNSTWAWCLWPNKWKQSTSYYCMHCAARRQCRGAEGDRREKGEVRKKACILGQFIFKGREKWFNKASKLSHLIAWGWKIKFWPASIS